MEDAGDRLIPTRKEPIGSARVQTRERWLVQCRWLDHTPLGRVGEPDDIASAILYLGSDEASWVTGHNLVVDGGLTITAGPVTRDPL